MPLAIVVLAVGLCTVSAGAEGVHPRLFFGPEDVPALREKVKREPFASMLKQIEREAIAPPDSSLLYDYSIRNQAYLYLLTGNPASAIKAEEQALLMVEDSTFWNDPGSKGLTRAMGALNVAIAYDLCANAWKPETKKRVSAQLAFASAKLMESMGAGANNNIANNWQAVRYGAAGLAALASDDPSTASIPKDAYAALLRHWRANLGGGAWNPEGIGYTIYPWGFSGPFGIAALRAGLGDVRKDVPVTRETLPTTLLSTVPIPHITGRGLHPDLSDDNPVYTGEGTAGLCFFYAQPDRVPQLKWIYDRIVGSKGDGTWDSKRAGSLYSLLFYPDSTPAENPAAVGMNAFVDETTGVVMFRNAFEDENDILATATATSRRASGGHSGPDVNSIRLIGLGSAFIVGGGRTGDTAGQSNLFAGPPPKSANDRLGSLKAFTSGKDGSGSALITGSGMGVEEQQRSFVVDYSQKSGVPALLACGETSLNGKLWRLNTPEFNAITTDGNTITLTSPVGSTLVITVLEPAQPVFRTGQVERGGGAEHLRFPYRGTKYINNKWVEFDVDRNVFTVMTLQPAKTSAPAVKGVRSLHGIEVKVGSQQLAFDFDDGVVCLGESAVALGLGTRKQPLKAFRFTAGAVVGGVVELRWKTADIAADRMRIERQSEGGPWEKVGECAYQDGLFTDRSVTEEATYSYRLTTINDHGEGIPTTPAATTVWPRKMKVWVEDFAPPGEKSNSLGTWTISGTGENLARLADDAGSPQSALAANGVLATGTQPIGVTHHILNESFRCDMSSPLSLVEFDLMSNAATGYGLLVRLADGQWYATHRGIEISRNEWKNIVIGIPPKKWFSYDLATAKTSGTAVVLTPDQLKGVQGLGLQLHHPINAKWAKIDQLRIRAEPAQ
jgi:hypothetical protein